MSNKSINKLTLIQENIKKIKRDILNKPEIICVSKTFSLEYLKPLIDHGHSHFGENKVQEAEEKWNKKKRKSKFKNSYDRKSCSLTRQKKLFSYLILYILWTAKN